MKKVTMQADELEVGMLVHHPDWDDGAPDRVGAIEEIFRGVSSRRLTVAGSTRPFWVHNSDYLETIES